MVSIGLFDRDSRLYYVDKDYAVIDNPNDDFKPTIVKRQYGDPNIRDVAKILVTLEMVLDGDPFYRRDGLWCNKLKANGVKHGKS